MRGKARCVYAALCAVVCAVSVVSAIPHQELNGRDSRVPPQLPFNRLPSLGQVPWPKLEEGRRKLLEGGPCEWSGYECRLGKAASISLLSQASGDLNVAVVCARNNNTQACAAAPGCSWLYRDATLTTGACVSSSYKDIVLDCIPPGPYRNLTIKETQCGLIYSEEECANSGCTWSTAVLYQMPCSYTPTASDWAQVIPPGPTRDIQIKSEVCRGIDDELDCSLNECTWDYSLSECSYTPTSEESGRLELAGSGPRPAATSPSPICKPGELNCKLPLTESERQGLENPICKFLDLQNTCFAATDKSTCTTASSSCLWDSLVCNIKTVAITQLLFPNDPKLAKESAEQVDACTAITTGASCRTATWLVRPFDLPAPVQAPTTTKAAAGKIAGAAAPKPAAKTLRPVKQAAKGPAAAPEMAPSKGPASAPGTAKAPAAALKRSLFKKAPGPAQAPAEAPTGVKGKLVADEKDENAKQSG